MLNGDYVWFLISEVTEKMSSKSVFILLADNEVPRIQYIYQGVILERNGLHVKSATAALRG